EAVLVDPDFLTTLPEREWQNGMAEVIKYAFLEGGRLTVRGLGHGLLGRQRGRPFSFRRLRLLPWPRRSRGPRPAAKRPAPRECEYPPR
ncbi:MAG: hypothetical protein H5T66_12015, partial [Chloroflexi bacterium]|nr:hypothetical protein [Chloroflexota bacterium]